METCIYFYLQRRGLEFFYFDENCLKRRNSTAGVMKNNLQSICQLPFQHRPPGGGGGEPVSQGLMFKSSYPGPGAQSAVGPLLNRSPCPLLNSCQFTVNRLRGRGPRALETGTKGGQVLQGKSPSVWGGGGTGADEAEWASPV